MATKHTPAPWTLEPAASGHCNFGIRVKGGHVAGFAAFINTRWSHPEQQEEQLANARLIAAAPDLLAALEATVKSQEECAFDRWLNRICPSGDVTEVRNQWEDSSDFADFQDEWKVEFAAIAKATGGAA